MKKLITTLIVSMMAVASHAEWGVEFAAGQFFDKDNNVINEAINFAVIVDMNDKGFADFEAQVGDTFDAKSFINANNDYMTLVTGSLSDPEGADAYLAYSDGWVFNNADYGFSGEEEVAVIVWNSTSNTLAGGENYVVATPSMAGNDLSEGDAWVIPTGDAGEWAWYLISQISEGTIANSFVTLSNTVAVPEPSTYAAIFGVIALGFVAYRRRK